MLNAQHFVEALHVLMPSIMKKRIFKEIYHPRVGNSMEKDTKEEDSEGGGSGSS